MPAFRHGSLLLRDRQARVADLLWARCSVAALTSYGSTDVLCYDVSSVWSSGLRAGRSFGDDCTTSRSSESLTNTTRADNIYITNPYPEPDFCPPSATAASPLRDPAMTGLPFAARACSLRDPSDCAREASCRSTPCCATRSQVDPSAAVTKGWVSCPRVCQVITRPR